MKPAIIVDLDGTLALRGGRHPLDVESAGKDELCVPVGAIVTLFARNGNPIIFMTYRDDDHKAVTVRWIAEKVGLQREEYGLFMRHGTSDPDWLLKRQWYMEHVKPYQSVLFAIDNSERCVRMWRELGVFCLQA